MSALATLPEPTFFERDPATITAEIVADYEAMTGKTLYPAQIERVLIDMIAYRETLTRIAGQEAAKLNLVRYSRYPILDYLGELVGVTRLAPSAALTTIRFTLIEAQDIDVVISAGTRVLTKDKAFAFLTAETLVIKAGDLTGDVAAACEATGTAANGYAAGEIATLAEPIAFVAGASNVTLSLGGAAIESDDRLRDRIMEAPERFSVAGARGAYHAFAMAAHQDLVDVAILGPDDHGRPGEIDVYPLIASGVPSAEIRDLLALALSADKVRPLGDKVAVCDPVAVNYTFEVEIIVDAGVDAEAVRDKVEAALTALAESWRARFKQDIIPSTASAAAAAIVGVHSVTLVAPAAFQTLALNQFADCTGVAVTVTGVDDG